MDEMRQEDIDRLSQTMPIPKGKKGHFLGRRTWFAVIALAAVGVLFMPPAASAGLTIGGTIAFIFAMAAYYLASFVGQLLLILVGALIYIAQYNGFVTAAPVANGWTIVRDIANMFFIVALLLIAFGTMLGLGGNYDYKNALPRFVIMAILVNFSRTICGLIIDFAQVVMLTFVNGFKEAAGGNFVDAFQITQLMQMDQPGEQPDFQWSVTLSMILALAFVCVASVVIVIMIAVLVVRIVYLWLLIVMSPLAFLASTIPVSKAKGFYSEWWDKFNNQVVVGPFLAFFLWLSLISVASGGIATEGFPSGGPGTGETAGEEANAAFSNIGAQGIQQFIIAIGLMLGGVAMAQQMSGAAVNMGKGLAKGAGKLAWRGAKLAGKASAYGVGRIPVGPKDLKTGRRMNLASMGTAASERFKQTGLYQAFSKEGRATTQTQREISALRAMGMKDAADMKQMSLIKGKAESMGKKFSSEQLRKTSTDDRASQFDRQASLVALAERADSSLWGKGAMVGKMVEAAGGTGDLEQMIRLQMKKHGDKDALMKDESDVNRYMASLTTRQKANEMNGIDKFVEVDENGVMNNTQSIAKLKSIERADVDSDQFSGALKKQIQDALLLAAQTAEVKGDTALKNELGAKYDELFKQTAPDGTTTGHFYSANNDARGKELYSAMEAKLAGKRAGKARESRLEERSVDLSVQRQLGSSSDSRGRAQSAYDNIKNIRADLAGGADLTPQIQNQIGQQLQQLITAAQGVSVRDASGKMLTGEDALSQTRIYRDLKAASTAPNSSQAIKYLDSASVSAGSSIRTWRMSPERRGSYYEAADMGARGLTRAKNTAGRLTSAATDSERRREAKRLAAQAKGVTSLMIGPIAGRTGGKGGVLPTEVQEQLKQLRDTAKSVKRMKVFDEANMSVIKGMQDMMDDIQKQLM